ncbi:hypothetical protein DB41_AE00190 [Neochlamydia sp. TUME1]|uniref:hypothetical protein n=1 Tax=Neochlamydia sp. TUME1 TaxID=1478174 RepID=UPI00057D6A5E|nr:hypothetical protein [Neochlamydia sp. TUME1]KIC71944.1 hypothetical protein DB41_AE00190 [Neochlamydia sp. TUME1]
MACSEIYIYTQEAEEFGIKVEKLSFDHARMVKRGDLGKMMKNLEGLIASQLIKLIGGFGKFISLKNPKQCEKTNECLA